MKFPWRVKKVETPKTPSDKLLEQVTNVLFPPLVLKTSKKEETGESSTYQVDYSVDSNLQAALYDLEEGHNDEVVQTTLFKILGRLTKARSLLEAAPMVDPSAQYIIVEDLEPSPLEELLISETKLEKDVDNE